MSRFTPNNEVELCGHATLAAAHALYETNRVSLNQPILFSTRYSGDLFAHRTNTGTIQLNFPSTPPSAVKLTTEETQLVLHAFSISENDIVFTGRSLYDLLIEVPSTVFKKVGTPNFKCIQDLAGRGVILTCSGAATAPATENDGKASHPCHDRRFSFISRGFFPWYVSIY